MGLPGSVHEGGIIESLPGLYDDAAAFPDFHVEAKAIEQQHTRKRCSIRRVGLNVSRLSVPEHRDAVDFEDILAAVGQDTRPRVRKTSPNSLTIAGGKGRKPL